MTVDPGDAGSSGGDGQQHPPSVPSSAEGEGDGTASLPSLRPDDLEVGVPPGGEGDDGDDGNGDDGGRRASASGDIIINNNANINNSGSDHRYNNSSLSSLISALTMEKELLIMHDYEAMNNSGGTASFGAASHRFAPNLGPTMEDEICEQPTRHGSVDGPRGGERGRSGLGGGLGSNSSSRSNSSSGSITMTDVAAPGASGATPSVLRAKRRTQRGGGDAPRGRNSSNASDGSDASYTFGGQAPVSRKLSWSDSEIARMVDATPSTSFSPEGNLEASFEYLSLRGGIRRGSAVPPALHPAGPFLPVLETSTEVDGSTTEASSGGSSPAGATADAAAGSGGHARGHLAHAQAHAAANASDSASESASEALVLSSITMDSALYRHDSHSPDRSSQVLDAGRDGELPPEPTPERQQRQRHSNTTASKGRHEADVATSSLSDNDVARQVSSLSSSSSSFITPPADSEIRFGPRHSPSDPFADVATKDDGRRLRDGRVTMERHRHHADDGHRRGSGPGPPRQQQPQQNSVPAAASRSPIDPPPHPPRRLPSNQGLPATIHPAPRNHSGHPHHVSDLYHSHHNPITAKHNARSPTTPTTLTSHTSTATFMAPASSHASPPNIPLRRISMGTDTDASRSVQGDAVDATATVEAEGDGRSCTHQEGGSGHNTGTTQDSTSPVAPSPPSRKFEPTLSSPPPPPFREQPSGGMKTNTPAPGP